MIFHDGELRQIDNSKPMLYDGWSYVPMEPRSDAVKAQLVAEDALTKRDAMSVSSPV